MDNSLIIQETAEENDLSRKSILKSTSKVGKLKTVRPVTYTQTNIKWIRFVPFPKAWQLLTSEAIDKQ